MRIFSLGEGLGIEYAPSAFSVGTFALGVEPRHSGVEAEERVDALYWEVGSEGEDTAA